MSQCQILMSHLPAPCAASAVSIPKCLSSAAFQLLETSPTWPNRCDFCFHELQVGGKETTAKEPSRKFPSKRFMQRLGLDFRKPEFLCVLSSLACCLPGVEGWWPGWCGFMSAVLHSAVSRRTSLYFSQGKVTITMVDSASDRVHLGNDHEELSLEYAASLLPKVFLAGGRVGRGVVDLTVWVKTWPIIWGKRKKKRTQMIGYNQHALLCTA